MPTAEDQKLRQILGTGGPGINNQFAFNPQIVAFLEMMLQNREMLRGELDTGGLSPRARTALESRAIESVPERFRQAETDLGANLSRRGLLTGATPSSGLVAPHFGELASEREKFRAGSLRDITLADEDMRQKQRMQILELLSRMPQMNFGGFGGVGGGYGGGGGYSGGGGGGGGVGSVDPGGRRIIGYGTSTFATPGGMFTQTDPNQPRYATGAFTSGPERQAYNRMNSFADYERNMRNPPLLGYLGPGGSPTASPAVPRRTGFNAFLGR